MPYFVHTIFHHCGGRQIGTRVTDMTGGDDIAARWEMINPRTQHVGNQTTISKSYSLLIPKESGLVHGNNRRQWAHYTSKTPDLMEFSLFLWLSSTKQLTNLRKQISYNQRLRIRLYSPIPSANQLLNIWLGSHERWRHHIRLIFLMARQPKCSSLILEPESVKFQRNI